MSERMASSDRDQFVDMADLTDYVRPLADELIALASRLKIAGEAAATSVAIQHPKKIKPAQASARALKLARHTYLLRRKRAAIFGDPDLFGEPAWDILLDLFIAAGEGKSVSVSSACIGSASPPTTGLRWLGVLTDHGLIARENDPEDNRRVIVKLTSSGHTAMQRFFEAMETGL